MIRKADYPVLVRLLAEGDAIFVPVRAWVAPRPAGVCEARAAFPVAGIRWLSGATSESGRKLAERQLKSLEDAGLVEVHRSKARAASVRLTETAEAAARKIAGLPEIAAGYATLERLAKLSDREPRTLDRRWVSEMILAESPDARLDAEELALPALCRGLIESNSDVAGRVYYAVTVSGWKWLNRPGQICEAPAIDIDRKSRASYYTRLKLALNQLAVTAPASPMEIGACPLPVAMNGVACA